MLVVQCSHRKLRHFFARTKHGSAGGEENVEGTRREYVIISARVEINRENGTMAASYNTFRSIEKFLARGLERPRLRMDRIREFSLAFRFHAGGSRGCRKRTPPPSGASSLEKPPSASSFLPLSLCLHPLPRLSPVSG